MKKMTLLSTILLCAFWIGFGQSGKTIFTELSENLYVEGVITIKLKTGVGNFEKQTGTVQFGIPTLDEKVDIFEVYQLEKEFRYNPAKLRPDLPDLSRIYKISFPGTFSVTEVSEAFSCDPNVEYAEPIPVCHAAEIPNDVLYSQLQHLPQIHAPEAWDIHKSENGAEEIIIAIVDSGVDWDHEDLQSNIWQNLAEDFDGDGHTMEYNGTQWVLDPGDLNSVDDDGNGFTDDLLGWNFITNNNDPNPIPGNPINGHGTHCAGLAAGATNNYNGIASISWNLQIMTLCVGQNNGISYGYDGIIYAAEKGADIISNSWGGSGYSNANQEIINYATGLGSIVLACAHNYDNTVLIYPASYQNVISVAAVTFDDAKTPYSNYNLAVDISAPGGTEQFAILSTIPDNLYGLFIGTSMSTPLVAGCFGLLKSYHPEWSNDQLITQMLGTADNIDSLNPDYINMLGTGRVNAYRMLVEDVLPLLKLELLSVIALDANGNGINEPDENVMLNFSLRNYAQGLGTQNVIVSISTEDPEISIINGSLNMYIPSDSSFVIQDQLQIQVGANASCHIAELNLHFESDSPIQMGQDFLFPVLVAPSGIFVFEGEENGQDYSGRLITRFLDHLGYDYTYANTLPSLNGFETAFLSYGNPGENMDKGTLFSENQSILIQQFLESGGNLYIEMGAMFYQMYAGNFSNKVIMKQLFGINSYISSNVSNPIDLLQGKDNTPFEDILFSGSGQKYNYRIDKLTPVSLTDAIFYESDYSNVAIKFDGFATYGHKAIYFGYSLGELFDATATSSRNNVLVKTMEFFGYDLQGYVLTNFLNNKTSGAPPLEVQFTDISISDPTSPITSWQWDFDNDGTIDSDDPNPLWTYNEGGEYTVKLITSNELNSDTLVVEGLITVNSGYLVYEGVEGGDDYSGIFIRDCLLENGLSVTYRNDFPAGLEGYSGVFLSFGNNASGATPFDDEMASALIDYLEGGGYAYLEGGDALGKDQAANTQLINLFGLLVASNGTGTNPINSLEGKPTALTHDMVFTGNSQVSNASIDKYAASSGGKIAFTESGYGTVGVQMSIPNNRRTFCFSYSLANLTDGDFPNTREELMHRILNFFDIYTAAPETKEFSDVGLSIRPNPAIDKITISSTANAGITKLSIFDVSGEKVLDGQLRDHETQIDISALPRGVYFVRLQNEKMVEVGKMVKE